MKQVEFETYPRPPIREAILDIFVATARELEIENLAPFGKKVEARFPDRKPRHRLTGNLRLDIGDKPSASAETTSTQEGWIFRTLDKTKATQARLNGFTFNRLPTYGGWAEFSAEAKELWETYAAVVSPRLVTEIGLRFINVIEVPIPVKDLREYCVLFPDLPKGVPQSVADFLMQFTGSSTAAAGATSSITVTFQPPVQRKAILPIILDVHVSQSFPNLPADDAGALWSAFELLRNEKNAIFESSITDAARRLFRK